MQPDRTVLGRGLLLGAAWLFWFLGGLAYVLSQGPIRSVLDGLSGPENAVLAVWLFVSTTLLFYAIVFIVRGIGGRNSSSGT